MARDEPPFDLAERGRLARANGHRVRAVTHLDVDRAGVEDAVTALAEVVR